MRWLLIGSLLAACSSPTAPRAPAAEAKLLRYEVITVGRRSGEAEVRIAADGRRTTHFTFNDRGRGPDVRTELTLDDAGLLRSFTATGNDYLKKPVDERLEQHDGKLWWTSTTEHGDAAVGKRYAPQYEFGGTLAAALLRARDHRLSLLPAGEASIEDDTPRTFDIAGVQTRLHRVAIAGLGFQRQLVWLDDHNEYFGEVSPWISTIRAGAAAAIPAMIADDAAWSTAHAAKLATLAHRPPAAGLAFTHAQLFDSERRTIVGDQTVVIVGDRITAVGGATTPIPAGAQVIDAHGRTLLPGLWDMHVHLGDADGTLLLASGITTVRDMGNDVASLATRLARFDDGSELGPHLLRAGLIDGPGPFAAPTGVLADTPEQAVAAVARFADAGYQQIKMYSSLKPELVPVIAAAAHARHLRVSGHIPNGMNAAQAVEAGYDEIQHVNMLFLRFLAGPGDDTRTPVRFTKVAEHASELDLASPPVQQFLDLLVAHKTVLDPTLIAFHGMFTSDAGELNPAMAPYASRLPAQVSRDAHTGGLPAPGAKRAQYRASYAALLRMVKAAWDRKIPIVAGTDDIAGLSLSHELELYVQAGIPAPDVLALATLGAARVMGLDRETGSIAVGKRADLALFEGDPTHDIGTVRNTRSVVCRGRLYDPAELFTAIGMKP